MVLFLQMDFGPEDSATGLNFFQAGEVTPSTAL